MKIAKNSKIFLFSLLLTFSLVFGCSEEEEVLTWMSPTVYVATAEADTLDLMLHTVSSWKLSTENEWITIEKASGGITEKDTIKIYIAKHTSRDERKGEVRLDLLGDYASNRVLTLTQEGVLDIIDADTTLLRLVKDDSSGSLGVSANIKWEVGYKADWLDIDNITEESRDPDFVKYLLHYTANGNTDHYPRIDSLVLVGTEFSENKVVIDIMQDPNSDLKSDSLALLALYNATNGSSWTTKWDLSKPLSDWDGVVLDSILYSTGKRPRVVGLSLNSSNLVGELPDELFNLSYLELLWLNDNKLCGTVSDRYSELIFLEDVRFSDNTELMGRIPENINKIRSLRTMSISNTKFSGTIPSTIGDHKSMMLLDLSNNQFSGELPSELGLISGLENLILKNNFFEGEIPASFKANFYWYDWDIVNMICPQRGTGFTNCVEN